MSEIERLKKENEELRQVIKDHTEELSIAYLSGYNNGKEHEKELHDHRLEEAEIGDI